MKAFAITRYKSPLRALDVPEPVVGERDVLVEIKAAGVNPVDAKVRDGAFKSFLPHAMPLVLGHDMAGVVVGTGAGVTRFKAGDEVFASPDAGRIGTFAERVAVSEGDLALKPKNLTMEEAASLPLVALTAWQALVERAQAKPGQKVFIQAGSGGVGTIAVQLARHLGAQVATTAGTANVDWVKSLGADVVVDYKTEDFAKVLSGYDVVFDTQGGKTLERSIAIVKPGGKLIGIAGPPDRAFARDLGLSWPFQQLMRVLSYRIRRAAARRGASYAFHLMHASGEQLGKIAALVEQGAIRPVVDRVFPVVQTPEALAYVETGRAKGKIVVSMA